MDFETIDALRSIIDYLKDDEKKNWEEMDRPDEHIYMDIIKVEKYLDGDGQ